MKLPFLKEAVSNLFSKPSTVEFPKVSSEAKPNYRGRIAYDPEKCVNCGMCIKVCSPAAITRTTEDVEGGEKITYEFDLTSCTFCGMCQDFCSEKAIRLTEDYHMVELDKHDLVSTGYRIKEKVKGKLTCGDSCVFCGMCVRVCPAGALTVDRATKTWKVDESKCVQCGLCIGKCPKKCLSFEEPAEEVVTLGEGCVYCTLCAKKCPVGAIEVDRANKSWTIKQDDCINCGACITGCPKKALSMGVPAAAPVADATAAVEEAPAPVAETSGEEQVVLGEGCVYCTLCAKKCPVGAIEVDRANKSWTIKHEDCIKCGACIDGCPKKALSMK